MLKFKMILEAIDRASAPVRRVRSSMAGMQRDTQKLAAAQRAGAAAGLRLRSGLGAMAGGFRRAGMAARAAAGRAGLAAWTKATELAKRGTGALIGKVGSLVGGMAKWGAAAGAAAGGFALFDLFSTTAQFEQFQIMLEGIEGSSAAAKKSLDWVRDFAQKTPYELADVMEAFIQLKAYGLDPMNGSLKAAGDAAAGMSKPIMQAVEAIADAVTGENERLKEFGITAAVAGDKVTFTYRKAGVEISKTARKGAEVERVLTGIFNDRFGGMMERQSSTFSGMISNLKDAWSNFLVTVGQAGIFDLVKSKLSAVLAKVNEWAKDGTLKAWAEWLSQKLEDAFNWAVRLVNETDWRGLVANFQALAAAAMAVAQGVLTIAANIGAITKAMSMFGGQSAYATMAYQPTQAEVGSKPLYDRAKDWWTGKGSSTQTAPQGQRGATPQDRLRAPPRPAPKGPFRTSANDAQVGGLIRIKLEAAPGTSARTASISSDNPRVPIQVELGRTMQGAA